MTLRTEVSDLKAAKSDSDDSQAGIRRLLLVIVSLLAVGVAVLGLRGTGVLSAIRNFVGLGHKPPVEPPVARIPTVAVMPDGTSGMTPFDTATGIDPSSPITIRLTLPNGPLDPRTVTDDSVGIFRFDTRERVRATVALNGTQIVATPIGGLEPSRNYRVEVPYGIVDVTGAKLRQTTRAFFTSDKPPAGVAFERVATPAAKGEGFTCLVFGPDGRLWASSHDGKLFRYDVATDGTLSNATTYTTLLTHEKGPRLVTGFTFGPESTPDAPVIYIMHSAFGFGVPDPVADFTSEVSRITGTNLDQIEDLVINLPRSARDHNINQAKFGPDGALYIPQPSTTAVGAPDAFWYMREEHLLTASILRLDTKALKPGQPLDARTIDVGGTFDPYAAGSPLTIYSTGLRMPYDLLWHSNGHLYTGVNGAASHGATPGGTDKYGTSVPAVADVTLAEHDWFFDIKKDAYHGHPNPAQKHFVLNGGNPTAAPDFNEIADYPVGVKPDPDWVPALYDFGQHTSANGLLEYKADRFNGALQGKVFICRYNVGSDLLCLTLSPDGNRVVSAVSGIPGTDNLQGPLDVVEDTRNGNLYVIEYHEVQSAKTQITLLRPMDARSSATRPVGPVATVQ
jgi:hypothetical protein